MSTAFLRYSQGLKWQGDNGFTVNGGNQGDNNSVNLILDIGDRLDKDAKKYVINFVGSYNQIKCNQRTRREVKYKSPVQSIIDGRIVFPLPLDVTKYGITYKVFLKSADDETTGKTVVSDIFRLVIKPTPGFKS